MRRYEVKTLAGAAKEVERILNTLCGHYLGWSKLETECSALTSLVRIGSAQNFHRKLADLLRIMDRHIELIDENLIYHLLNITRTIDIKFPMTPAGTAAVRGRKYPTLGAICQYWYGRKFSARAVTDMAKEVLPEIPAHRARVEQLDKTIPGFQHEIDQYTIWDNAPLDKWEDAEFRRDFKELMEDANALMQGRAPRN